MNREERINPRAAWRDCTVCGDFPTGQQIEVVSMQVPEALCICDQCAAQIALCLGKLRFLDGHDTEPPPPEPPPTTEDDDPLSIVVDETAAVSVAGDVDEVPETPTPANPSGS